MIKYNGTANRPHLPSIDETYLDTATNIIYTWDGDSFNQVGVGLSTANNNTVLVGADGAGVLKGPMVSGAWFSSPSVFRLRITGTGTVTLASRDSAGTVTTVDTYTVSGATDQIEFPYAGDNAVAIRATLTGTTTVEVI